MADRTVQAKRHCPLLQTVSDEVTICIALEVCARKRDLTKGACVLLICTAAGEVSPVGIRRCCCAAAVAADPGCGGRVIA